MSSYEQADHSCLLQCERRLAPTRRGGAAVRQPRSVTTSLYVFAPRYEVRRKMSQKMPPAVTSGPDPGPQIVMGVAS